MILIKLDKIIKLRLNYNEKRKKIKCILLKN